MTSENERDIQNQKVAKLWGSSWQKLSPKQRQLVGEIMQDVKLVSIGEHLEVEVSKMPLPDFANVTSSDRSTDFSDRSSSELSSTKVVAITWQSVLEKTTAALVEQRDLKQLPFIFQEFDYQQITKNSLNDISTIVSQLVDLDAIAKIETQLEQLKELFSNYCRYALSSVVTCCEISLQGDLIHTLEALINQTKSLGLLGLGAFVLIANLHIWLLQEKAKSEPKEWQNLNRTLKSYIAYAKNTIPLLFKLSVGKIDKTCTCRKYLSIFDGDTPEYECRYFDGKDVYIFRDRSKRVGYECNKHRLKMFHSTVDRVMQVVVQPLRSTIKTWEKLVAQTSLSSCRDAQKNVST